MWLSWANEGPFLSRTHKLLIVLIYWKIGRKRGKVRQLHKTLYHHLSLPSIKKTLVAVATVKPHSGSSSSKIQNLSKTLTYNTVLSHPEDRFLALLCCLKRKRLSKELMNPSQGFCCKVRFCRDNYLKSLKFLPPPPPPTLPFFFSFPSSFFHLLSLHYEEGYSMQLISSQHLPALSKMPTRPSGVTPSLIPSLMGKAHAMGTTSRNPRCNISRSGKAKSKTGLLPNT